MHKTPYILLLTLCVGCASIRKTEVYQVSGFTLEVKDKSEMGNLRGHCDYRTRTLSVRYGDCGDPIDFYALGHEVWHLVKGNWHK